MGVSRVMGKSFASVSEKDKKAEIIKAIEDGVKEALDVVASGKIPDYVWDEV